MTLVDITVAEKLRCYEKKPFPAIFSAVPMARQESGDVPASRRRVRRRVACRFRRRRSRGTVEKCVPTSESENIGDVNSLESQEGEG
jgi:hypothetical protein